jgi:hypothetical protein
VPVVAAKPAPEEKPLRVTKVIDTLRDANRTIADLRAENEQLRREIIDLQIERLSPLETVNELNCELIATLTDQRERALLTARRRGRQSVEVAELRAALDIAHAQVAELQSRPSNPALVAAPNDAITLAYLRAWYGTLSRTKKDELPALVHELVVPWHKRGITWHQVVLNCGGIRVGKTPYDMSPPKKVHAGQGAIQPKPAA